DPTAVVAAGGQALRDAILKERLLELSAEGKRRADMVRHGKFLNWTESSVHGVCGASPSTSCPARAAYRVVFPISVNAIGSNPLLAQNKGY
ncbi:MAG: hypothetical protein DMD26_14775, partial [Gemmatimonadetes bacterium]